MPQMLIAKIGFLSIQLSDIIDIFLIALLFYYLMVLLRGTRAIHMTLGIVSLMVMYIIASWIHLNTVVWLISIIGKVGVISLVVIFQPELRGALARIGTYGIVGIFSHKQKNIESMEEISKAAIELSNRGFGGLIVIEKNVGLKIFIETGKLLTSKVNSDILVSLFFTNAPLHDGAVIIRGDNIIAAGCTLPLTNNKAYDYLIGMRHRAAVGISSESDAITVVVSEETGNISIAHNSHLRSNIPPDKLNEMLVELMKA